MIYVDFESILVPKENGKQNLDESYTNKFQKHVPCSCDYKVVCLDDTCSKPFESYLGEDTACNFINSVLDESKYCCDVMKKLFNKEFMVNKKDNEDSVC